jgi:WD40 repeat protein
VDIANIEDGKEMYILKPQSRQVVSSLFFTRNNEHLCILRGGRTVFIFSAASGCQLQERELHTEIVIFIRPFGERMVSASWNGMLQLWDSSLLEEDRLMMDGTSVCGCLSPTEDAVAVPCRDRV